MTNEQLHKDESQAGRGPGTQLRNARRHAGALARTPLEGKSLGLSLLTLGPGFRIPFAHKHAHQEEVYVVVRGSARIKVEDEIVDLGQWDAIRIDEDTLRAVEAGPEGVEYLAFGAGDDPRDADLVQDWWRD
jgi:mannose-6-phosphate isomerase-like protein (cupin superfamily)